MQNFPNIIQHTTLCALKRSSLLQVLLCLFIVCSASAKTTHTASLYSPTGDTLYITKGTIFTPITTIKTSAQFYSPSGDTVFIAPGTVLSQPISTNQPTIVVYLFADKKLTNTTTKNTKTENLTRILPQPKAIACHKQATKPASKQQAKPIVRQVVQTTLPAKGGSVGNSNSSNTMAIVSSHTTKFIDKPSFSHKLILASFFIKNPNNTTYKQAHSSIYSSTKPLQYFCTTALFARPPTA